MKRLRASRRFGLTTLLMALAVVVSSCGGAASVESVPAASPSAASSASSSAAKPAVSAGASVGSSGSGAQASSGATADSSAAAGRTFRGAISSTSGAFVPLWEAIESGAFKQQGINIQITNMTSTAEIAAVASDQLDGTFLSSPAIVNADAGGVKLVMAGSMLDHPLFSVYSQKSITDASQLKGKPFGCGKAGSPVEYGCLTALKQLGLAPNDVELLRVDNESGLLAALLANQVQASILQPPGNFQAERQGYKKLAGIPSTPFQSIGLTIKASRMNELRPILVPMLRALQMGIRRFNSDKDFSLSVLKKYSQEDDADLVARTYDFYKQVGFQENMKVDREGLLEVMRFAAATNPNVSKLNVDELYDNSYADQLK